jgi:excisionase family DNA binding protein
MGRARTPRRLAEYLTIRDAADLIGVSAMTLRRWDQSGKFRARRHPINRYRLYLRDELLVLLRRIEDTRRKGKR